MCFASESEFEKELIRKLTSDCGWNSNVLYHQTEAELIRNWANILFRNNMGIDRLNGCPLTDGEMNQIIRKINELHTPVQLNSFINGKTLSIMRDNPDDAAHLGQNITLKIYDRTEIAGGDSCYQIAEQPIFNVPNPMLGNRRGDFTLLINGMPFIHVELKKTGVPLSRAYEQIKRYAHEGVFSQGLFSLVQVFVIMTPEETMYFANPGPEGQFRPEFCFHWTDISNRQINEWNRIAESLLSIPMAHQLIGFYTIADQAKNILKVMRSYQYYATKAIVDRVFRTDWENPEARGGYVFHTTGSGKTMTSFKAAQIIAELGYADKIVFLMDRIELGSQSFDEYTNFANNMIEVQATDDTEDLVNKLRSPYNSDKLIVTSHQKMCRIRDLRERRANDIAIINRKRIVLIVDEAHRDVVGEMFAAIRDTFPKAVRFGFTGTPILEGNRNNETPTVDVFGGELHRYTIANGINDKNVLGFDAVPVSIYPANQLRLKVALEKAHATSSQEAMSDPGKREIFLRFNRDLPMAYKIDENGTRHAGIEDYLPQSQYRNDEYYRAVVQDIKDNWETLSMGSKFHAILATSSIPEAIRYYNLVREAMPDLKVTAVFDPSVESENGILIEDSIVRIMGDYRDMFGMPFTLAQHKEFKKDVAQRLAHKKPYIGIENDRTKQLNMVIVVNQLLTGFDSCWINTLYMDKVQENENIIQSFSRTNRLFNSLEKPFGVIRYYRLPYTMKNNVERAIRDYVEADPALVFVSKLESQLNGMNQTFGDIKHVFENAGIPDFSRLPEAGEDKGKFADRFREFSKYLAAARVQDFSWDRLGPYEFTDDRDGNNVRRVTVLLDETTYHILLQRYKELTRGDGTDADADVPYDIDPNITEIDTERIDNEYMNARFTIYVNNVLNGGDSETQENLLADLHRSFSMLNQREQEFANLILGDIQRGNLQIAEGMTFRDYLTQYMVDDRDGKIHRFAEELGLNEPLLRQIMIGRPDNADINVFGDFANLLGQVDFDRATAFLSRIQGEPIPPYLVMPMIDPIIRKFIQTGEYDI